MSRSAHAGHMFAWGLVALLTFAVQCTAMAERSLSGLAHACSLLVVWGFEGSVTQPLHACLLLMAGRAVSAQQLLRDGSMLAWCRTAVVCCSNGKPRSACAPRDQPRTLWGSEWVASCLLAAAAWAAQPGRPVQFANDYWGTHWLLQLPALTQAGTAGAIQPAHVSARLLGSFPEAYLRIQLVQVGDGSLQVSICPCPAATWSS